MGQLGSLLPHVVVPSILAAFLIPEWHLSGAQAGLLAGSGAAGYMLTVPVLATLTDRIDARKILIAGSALSALGTLLFGLFATGLWSGALFNAIAGVGFAGAYMPGLKALTDRLAPGDSSRAITLYTSSFSFGVGVSFLVSQLVAEAWGWRSAFFVTAAGPLVMLTVCLLLRPVEPKPASGRLLDFAPVFQNRKAMGFVLGYGAHCFELYGIRTWIVAFWTFVAARNSDASILTPIVVSVVFSMLAMPASILGNEFALRFGRHRAISAVMFASAAVALLIGIFADKSPWLLLPLMLVYAITVPADSGALTSGMSMAADPNYRGATMAMHSTVGFSLSALGAWAVGVALDAAGGPQSSAAWMAAFSVLAAGILLGPLALYWSRRETPVNRSQFSIIVALGTTQTLAWASSYYLPAILADPIARDLGVSSNWIFAAFSASLVISAMLGPRIGRQIDLVGGRSVLSLSNLVLAAGLALLGLTYSIPVLLAAWLLLGIGMGAGLYDAAFGALGRIYGDAARRSITGITLIAGFASTVGWPLTAWGLETIGWRNTCFAWAAAHILIGLPINWLMLPPVAGAKAAVAAAVKPHIPLDRTMILLAFAFAAAWSVTGAMAAHLPRILEAAGATSLQAVAAGALIGPSQVAARIFEASFLSRYHPLVSGRLACLTHPIGAAIIGLAGGGAASVFAVFHGTGNGILTIARGTMPLAIFGPQNYAYRLGIIGAPARIAQAGAPLAFSLLIDVMGSRILIVSSALSLSALLALCLLRAPPPRSVTKEEDV